MKKCIYLIAITFLFASCSKTIEESTFIPKDAIGVMYVNLKSLSEKSNDLDFKNLNINDLIEDKAPKKVKRFLNELLTKENLNNTFRQEFILGFATYKRLSGVGGVILPIKDANAFEDFIQPMLDNIPNLEKETNVGKDEGFTVYSNRELAIGFNDKTALIIGANKYAGAELKDLTNLDKEESILSTSYYSSFFDTNKDMGLHITSTPLGDAFDGLLNTVAGLDINLENNNLSYYGSFEDDHIYTSTKLKLNKDITSLLGHKKWMTTSYNKSMLEALPSNPLVLAKIAIDNEALYDHIVSLGDNKLLPVQVREEIKKGLKKSNREFEKEIGLSNKDFSKIFDNSYMFAMTEGETVKDTIYDYNYFTDVENYKIVDKKTLNMYGIIAMKDKAKFDDFLNRIKDKGAPLKQISKDYYEIDKNSYMVITEDFIFFTNNIDMADQIKNKGQLADNLSKFEYKDKLSHSVYLYTRGDFTKLTNDFSEIANIYGLGNPYGRYNAYGSDDTMDRLTKKSSELYEKYYGENHYIIDLDGSESFINTKGDKNSLIQTILYGDELSKIMSDFED